MSARRRRDENDSAYEDDSDEDVEKQPAKKQRQRQPLQPHETEEILLGEDFTVVGQKIKIVGVAKDVDGKFGRIAGPRTENGYLPVTLFDVHKQREKHGIPEDAAGARAMGVSVNQLRALGFVAVKPHHLEVAAPQPLPFRDLDVAVPVWQPAQARDTGPALDVFALAMWYDKEKHSDLKGYVAMEKYDGIRVMWEGTQNPPRFRTRSASGGGYKPPPSFAKLLPKARLDGELWIGRGRFEEVQKAVVPRVGEKTRSVEQEEEFWRDVRFKVWDAPAAGGPFSDRIEAAREALLSCASPLTERVHVVQSIKCESDAAMRKLLTKVESYGGEGLVLRNLNASFKTGKTNDLLKVKSSYDAECKVLDHNIAHGKESLHVMAVESGTRFDVSCNFGDLRGKNLPPPGSICTYRYQGITIAGVPRFQSLVRVHDRSVCTCTACGLADEEWPEPMPPMSVSYKEWKFGERNHKAW